MPRQDSYEVTAANFMTEVMEASLSQLVIVSFWAPWSEPCKQMAPVLEKLIATTKGAAKLTRIDIDKNPQIAAQMRVQSVPTVFAFFDKKIADGFMGVLPEPHIKEWISQLIQATGAQPIEAASDDTEAAMAAAKTFLENDQIEQAQSLFASLYDQDQNNAEAFAGLLRCMISQGQAQTASDFLSNAPESVAKSKLLTPLRTAIDLALQAGKTPENAIEALSKQVDANANDHQARFDLALAHYAQGNLQDATDCLLEIVKRDRKWQDDGARNQLVKIFEALGPTHPQTIEARKKLSTILFS